MDVFKNKFCDSYRLNLACVNLLSMIAGLESGQLNEVHPNLISNFFQTLHFLRQGTIL